MDKEQDRAQLQIAKSLVDQAAAFVSTARFNLDQAEASKQAAAEEYAKAEDFRQQAESSHNSAVDALCAAVTAFEQKYGEKPF